MNFSNGILLHSDQEWSDLVASLNGPVYALLDESESPQSFPCMAKIAKATLADYQGEDIDVFIVIFFYKGDARTLLGIERANVGDYKYAEAV